MESLIRKLTLANEAYRNGKALLMTDEEYDAGLEKVSSLFPDHPLLKQVRARPEGGKLVKMPYYLGSLDKAKTEEELAKWVKKAKGSFIVSDKLDGISGLWNPAKSQLYLSGDDNTGLDVSSWLPHMSLSPSTLSRSIPSEVWIRGELIMPRSLVPEGKLGRSIINGIFHQKVPNPVETAKVRFVAYEIIDGQTHLAVEDQFATLNKWCLWMPWFTRVEATLNAQALTEALAGRRRDSEYEMDGLVVKTNTPILQRVSKGNPKDAVAWKPPNGESKLTRVVNVEWNASATGKLIPRVQIEPVHLGGSTITFVTGVNARRIVDWKIGPGASVIIRKGGDVIPLIEAVEDTATVVFPPTGTWEWDGPEQTAIHIRQKVADSQTLLAQYMKMVTNLDWANVGPAVMKAVIEAGHTTVPLLRQVPEADLKKLLGPVKGANLYRLVQGEGWSGKSEIELFAASPLRPDGIGKTRLECILAVEPDFTKWTSPTLRIPKGWSADALREFQVLWSSYEKFRKEEWSFLDYPVKTRATVTPEATKGSIVFSGFRDAEIEAALTQKGYKISDTVRSDTRAVLISDAENPLTYSSGKIEKAKKIPGCSVLCKANWINL